MFLRAPFRVVGLPANDYVGLEDACHPPGAAEAREAVLVATLGRLSDEVALSWTSMDLAEEANWEAPDNCLQPTGAGVACGGCANPGGGAAPWAVVLLATLVARRRR